MKTAFQISRAMISATKDNVPAVAKTLMAITKEDEALIEDCRKESAAYKVSESWMMVNVVLVIACVWTWMDSFLRTATVICGCINIFCLWYKQGKKVDLSIPLMIDYFNLHAQFLVSLATPGLGLLAYNILFWVVCGYASNWILAHCPASVASVLGYDVTQWGDFMVYVCVRWTFLRKGLMLCETMYNYDFYIKALKAKTKRDMTFVEHVVDVFYAATYTAVANTSAVVALYLLNHLAQHFGFSSTVLCIALGAVLRAPFGMNTGNIRVLMYFASHRIFHRYRPLFLLYHREHHYPFHQTCLGASQESGMCEAPVEALFVSMCYAWVPHLDMMDWVLDNHVNEFFHHYYDEYDQSYWVIVRFLTKVQDTSRGILGRLACFEQPLGCDNMMYGYGNVQLGEGPIADSWHGKHHWATHVNFGYGTFDSVLNNAKDTETLEKVVQAYLEFTGKVPAPAATKKVD